MNALEWIKNKFSRRSKQSACHPKMQVRFAEGTAEHIRSPYQAMCIDTAYRCVDILSGTIASIPLEERYRRGGVYEREEYSRLAYLFQREANERQSFFCLMENAIVSLLLRGNAYILPISDERGEYEALYLLRSEAVAYDVQTNRYTVTDPITGFSETLEAWQIIHLRNKSIDGGYIGVSTIEYAGRSLALAAQADQQALEGMRQGHRLSGFLSSGDISSGFGALQDSTVQEIAERIEAEINSGRRIMRMPGTVKFDPVSLSPADAQLLESRKFSPYSICRFFGVHPDMVFIERTSANYKDSENSQTTFLTQTLRPILRQIETEFSCKLIRGSRQVKLKRKIAFDLTALYATDLKSRAEYYKLCIEAGIMTPNEVRQAEDRQPLPGGDVSFISCNVAPLTDAGKKQEQAQEPQAE